MLPAIGPPRTTRRPRLSRRPPRPRRRCGGRPARRPRARRRATPCRSACRTGSPEPPSLSHVAPSGVAELSLRRLGLRQSPRPFLRHALLSNRGPFPPPALPGFPGTTGLSATLTGPAWPSRAVGWRVHRQPAGLPVLRPSPSSTRAVATTPAEAVGARVARFPAAGSLPRVTSGSASASAVSGPARRSLALRPAWSLSRPGRPFVVGVLQPMSLPPSSAPTATGWSDSCRAGFAPAEERGLSRRTVAERLRLPRRPPLRRRPSFFWREGWGEAVRGGAVGGGFPGPFGGGAG